MTPPLPPVTIARAASRAPTNAPRRLTSRTRSHSSRGELEQRGRGVDAGGVHPGIETPQARADVLGQRADRRFVADVDLGRDCRRPERRGRSAGGFAVDVGDDHRRARLGEPGAAGAPDAARSPGDDRNLPRERHELREGGARGVVDRSHEANLSSRAPL